MKKIIYVLLLTSVLFFACSKDDSNTESVCPSIQNFTASQVNNKVSINILSNNQALYYEISIQPTGSNDPENGTIYPLNNVTSQKTLNELNLYVSQTYILFVRAICTDGSKSAWSNPKTIVINDFCEIPFNLEVVPSATYTSLTWDNYASISYYQVQYGYQGFALGTGTTIQVNSESFDDIPLEANKTYDFYVRAYCNSALGWSEWSQPVSYYSPTMQNLCTAPSNVTFYNEGSGYRRAQWNMNGESLFEIVVVNPGQNVSLGSPTTISSGSWPVFYVGTGRDFYVRAICSNGNRTVWSGPWSVN